MIDYGFLKVATATPILKVANVQYNIEQIEKLVLEANSRKVKVLVFPELSVTGYTCGDLFNQKILVDNAMQAVVDLTVKTRMLNILTIVGLPVLIEDQLYNCSAVLFKGRILGIVPKMFLQNKDDYCEKRWFSAGSSRSECVSEITCKDFKIPFGNLIFKDYKRNLKLGIEFSDDLFSLIPTSSFLASNGANIIANLSAICELADNSNSLKITLREQSLRAKVGYIFCGAGVNESTTDLVFSGQSYILENGRMISESKKFCRENSLNVADIDIDSIAAEKLKHSNHYNFFKENLTSISYKNIDFEFDIETSEISLDRGISPYPYLPAKGENVDSFCEDVTSIQVAGLAKRFLHIGAKKAIVAVSGGLDSTLALLVTVKVFDRLKITRKNIIAITMPGFGTTQQTYNLALTLMETLQVDVRVIDIKPACTLHMKDVDHNPNVHDLVFENIQARERMQILMDVANKENGIVIGTGDLSELALGWTTYNGDHMSMYGVNSGVPKTLIRYLIAWEAGKSDNDQLAKLLSSIVEIPISPELLPPDKNGEIKQKTEDKIGEYELHDFYLYYTLRWGTAPEKLLFLAKAAFNAKYDEIHLRAILKLFYSRFFSQQFKRSALPDGPKILSIGLSPRGDWKMPSDADASLWMKTLE